MKSKNNPMNLIRWPVLLMAAFLVVAAGYASVPAGNVEAASAAWATTETDDVVTAADGDKTQVSLSPATYPALVTAPAAAPDPSTSPAASNSRGASIAPNSSLPSTVRAPYPAAVRAALEVFGKEMGVTRWQIQVVAVTSAQWPDGCLGLGERNEACTLAIVAGWQVIVRAEGETYEIRTDLTGSRVRWQLISTSPVVEAYS